MRGMRRRREAILAIIATRRIETQEELVAALHGEGIAASQASVSRDIATLGLVKAGGNWVAPAPVSHAANPAEERIRAYLLGAEPAGPNLVVLKTPPGEAPGVALAFDHLDLPGVVGSVAGDDTIFAAVSSRTAALAVIRRLESLRGRAATQPRKRRPL